MDRHSSSLLTYYIDRWKEETAKTMQANTDRFQAERTLAAARAKAQSDVTRHQNDVKRNAVEYVAKLTQALASHGLTVSGRKRLETELKGVNDVIASFQPLTAQARSDQPGQPARSGEPAAPARPVGTGLTRQARVAAGEVKVQGPHLESRNGQPHNYIVRLTVPGQKPVSTTFSFSKYGGQTAALQAAEEKARDLRTEQESVKTRS